MMSSFSLRSLRLRSTLLAVALLLAFASPLPVLAQTDAPLGPAGEPLMRDDAPRVAPGEALSVDSMIELYASGDYRIDSLLSPYRWPATWTQITYSFYDWETFGGSYYGSETVSEVSEGVKSNVRQIMAWYGSIINVNFVEVTETTSQIGYLRFMDSTAPGYAYAYYPSSTALFALPGDVHLNVSYDRTGDTNGFQNPPGSHGYMSIAHEVGHALGLKHPHEGDPILPANEDNTSTTIMTYDFKGPSAGTPMPLDHLALHYLYGQRAKWTGDDNYVVIRNVDQYLLGGVTYLETTWSEKETIWDAGGFNTLDFSQTPYNSGGLRLDMRGIGWLTVNTAYHGGSEPYFDYGIAIPEGVVIRDLVNSSSSDTIYANSYANTFKGYASSRATGADVVYGATTADAVDLTGYAPANVTQTQSGNDHVIGLGANGSITLRDYYLSANNQPAIIFVAQPPAISIADASINEGNSGTTNLTFMVSLSYPAPEAISIQWTTADGSAVAPGDYVAASGTISFPTNATSQQVTVAVVGDTVVESDETFTVNLGAVTGNATVADGQAVGTIRNDAQPPPNAPTNLTATAASSSQINLAWTDNATNESGFYVERDSGAGYTRIATLGANATSYANMGLAAGTTHSYRVQAYHSYGASAFSNTATATTSTAPKIHVGDLDAGRSVSKKNWTANVTVAIHDASEKGVASAAVTGTWSNGATGTGTCTTSNKGSCTISKSGLALSTPSVTFTVTGVTKSGYAYDAALNHDVDGGTNGTTAVVVK